MEEAGEPDVHFDEEPFNAREFAVAPGFVNHGPCLLYVPMRPIMMVVAMDVRTLEDIMSGNYLLVTVLESRSPQ